MLRKSASSAAASGPDKARGSGLGVRTRSRDRGAGRRFVCARSPLRSPAANHELGRPFGIGDTAGVSPAVHKPAQAG